ncbi:31798_t:CDS:2 [Gigaspora margarita]|uniref:31798_t:CDS:1 n=1 Tax=Gigaspora margarita TaxID=4874 RepID=A0ABN7UB51_GIGMA|nr:31798_t:CDS:2 [Gigaspora margarita]
MSQSTSFPTPSASASLELMRPTTSDLISSENLFLKQKKVFERFASVEISGQKFMNQNDFISAIAPGEDYKKIQKEQFGILFRIADKEKKGLISFQDFVIFENLLLKPDAEYEIAFRLFDVEGKGTITTEQFKKILFSNITPDSIPFDFDCEWLKLYVGRDPEKKHELAYEEFTQLLKGLQSERLRQEFKFYDKEGTGYITPDNFKKIILSIARHKISDYVVEHLPTLCNIYAGNKINYASVVAFHNVVRQMDMVERIVNKAVVASSDGKITKIDFLNTASRETRFSLFTPLEADIIFHFAGLGNPSGRLSRQDFAQLLDPKWERREIKSTTKKQTKQHTGVGWEILHQIYSFALGSIAGAVGATVVYPIDLVKTRMQNQRSKVVGELLYRNSIDCFKKVVQNEGLVGLYSGLGPQLVGVAPEKAIKLTVNDFMRSLFKNKDTGFIPLHYEILSGGIAGGCQVIFTNPLEIVKIRLQIQGEVAKNIDIPRKSAVQIVKELGLFGLYRGASACLLRDIPFSGIYFSTYAHLKKDLFGETPDKKCSIIELLIAGAAAGMPAAYLTTPADVIKTRLQVETRKGQTSYNGIFDACRKIFREEGFKAFFKGGPARILRSSPQFGTTLMVYEILQRLLPWSSSEEKVGKVVSAVTDSGDLGYLKSRNALKILLDLDYKFGVVPKSVNVPIPS